ncbi:MAG: response regulator transcription factor [Verrucomicrobiota bacterium]
MTAPEIKILLVDDHRLLREGLRTLLQQQPGLCVVGEAGESCSAVEQVRTVQPDVVIMDVHLPGENGVEISAQLHTEFPHLKVIILSGDIELTTIKKALQAGVSGYLTKNDPPEEVVRALREVMDHRIHLSPEISGLVAQDYAQTLTHQPPEEKPALSERERQLLRLVAEGKRNKEIAETLQVTAKSVETYRSRLMHKLNCNSAAELTRYALREGIASL